MMSSGHVGGFWLYALICTSACGCLVNLRKCRQMRNERVSKLRETEGLPMKIILTQCRLEQQEYLSSEATISWFPELAPRYSRLFKETAFWYVPQSNRGKAESSLWQISEYTPPMTSIRWNKLSDTPEYTWVSLLRGLHNALSLKTNLLQNLIDWRWKWTTVCTVTPNCAIHGLANTSSYQLL